MAQNEEATTGKNRAFLIKWKKTPVYSAVGGIKENTLGVFPVMC